jgi:hypothetical protein
MAGLPAAMLFILGEEVHAAGAASSFASESIPLASLNTVRSLVESLGD